MNIKQMTNQVEQRTGGETYMRSYLLIPACALIALVLLPFIA